MDIAASPPTHWRPLLRAAGLAAILGVGIYIGAEIAASTLDVLNDIPPSVAIDAIQSDAPAASEAVIDSIRILDVTRPASPDSMLPAR